MKSRLLLITVLFVNILFSQNYHDTQGKLDVSSSGQATYTIPIANPPTLNDVAPTINLVYVSGQMGGIGGQGWNIASISAIQRIATRKDIDGYTDGVDFDSNDMLALDGQRLILKTGTYWAAGSTYETEVMSNTKIELMGSGSSMYFIVTTPDGARSWYGMYGSAIAKDITAFYILRYEDTWGNYIAYSYSKPFNKSLCIDKIYYSANGSAITPQNSINFYYKQAKRTETAFVGGNRIEKVELLDKIEVYTGGLLFRKYQLTHVADPHLGYEKLTQVQEFNGANEPANPIVFEYNDTQITQGNAAESALYTHQDLSTESGHLSGDFDGDGKLDIMTNSAIYTNLFATSNPNQRWDYMSEQIIPDNYDVVHRNTYTIEGRNKIVARTLKDNKLNQFNSIVTFKENENSTDINIYSRNSGTGFYESYLTLDYTKNIAIDNLETISASDRCTGEESSEIGIKDNAEYIEGDFNGDGISEIFLLNTVNQESSTYIDANYAGDCSNPEISYYCGWDSIKTYLLDLNPNSSTNLGSKGYVKFNNDNFIKLTADGQKHYTADFNGDGKTDILFVNMDKSYRVYGFKQLTQAPWVELEIIGQGSLSKYEFGKELFFGDFNGDSKIDILTPDTKGGDGHNNWWIHYGNPMPNANDMFSNLEIHNITEYNPYQEYKSSINVVYKIKYQSYFVTDTNGDGKSDLVRVYQQIVNTDFLSRKYEWRVWTYSNKIGQSNISGTKFPLEYASESDHGLSLSGTFSGFHIPIVTPFEIKGLSSNVLFMIKKSGSVKAINLTKNVKKDVLLTKIISNNGSIIDEISYKEVKREVGSDFYTSSNTLNYPLIEISKVPDSNIVSMVKNSYNGNHKYMDFKYEGLIMDLQGLGIIGFRKYARSSWSSSIYYDRILWNFSVTRPDWRGAIEQTYTSLNRDGSLPINQSFNTFNAITTANKIYKIWLTNQKTIDNIAGVTHETIYETYDTNYLIPTKVVAKNYLNDSPNSIQGTTTTIKEFYNNASGVGNSYYIGRPKSTLTTTTAYNDTFKTLEKYNYTGIKLTKIEKKGNTTDEKYIVEDFLYDNYGNILKKTLSSTGYTGTKAIAPRIEEYTYDPTGRFVKTHKDIEGLITTNNVYHPLYGLVKSVTDPFGRTTLSEFDNWGKAIKNTNYLGKSVNYTYVKSGNEYAVTTTGDDGSSSVSVNNALGQELRKGVKDIQSNWSWVKIEYDYLGRKTRQSEPYYANATPSLWSVPEYDEYSRHIKTYLPTGLVTSISYNGLSVTVTDGNKTSSTTINANGHTTATTDNGGTINYNYYANGSLKNSILAGTPITFEYDEWGRKTKMNDPSLGIYQYEYNAIGETLREISPNGTTTFNLNAVGKLISKYTTTNNAGSVSTSYFYDLTTKLLTDINHTDNITSPPTSISYNYQYDIYKRPWKTTETTNQAVFERETTYDYFLRPSQETYKAVDIASGKQSNNTVYNNYINGYLQTIVGTDNGNTGPVYRNTKVNERGQVTEAYYGYYTKFTNTYDQYGLPTGSVQQYQTGNSIIPILTLTNPFDPQRGNLLSRTNSMFGWNEIFQYDSLDRLTQYKNMQGVYVTQNYDPMGKITSNEVGNYYYTNAAKPYQNTSVDLNTDDIAYYENREGIFNDDMENSINWSFYTSNFSYDTTQKYTGNKSLKITNTTSSEAVILADTWVPINNAIETQYTYSGWVYSNGPQSEIFLFMKTDTEIGYFTYVDNVLNNTTNQWVYVEKTFNVPANVKKLGIRLDNNGVGTIWFDDVRIKKTNEQANALRQLDITYNAFRRPISISETGVDRIDFKYNAFDSRSEMYYGSTSIDKNVRPYRKFYSADGRMEIKRNITTNEVDFITYIGGDAYTAPLVIKSDGVTNNYLYLHRDYQGTILAISNKNAEVLEKRLFDAWGNVLKIVNKQGQVLSNFTILDRGYTGHEHLMSVGLINMNARLYDPKLHRFLQADSEMQDPTNTQYYNRYSYVLNNPLRYVDPDGNHPAVIGAFIALAIDLSIQIYRGSDVRIGIDGAKIFQTILFSGISMVATFGIGEMVQGFSYIKKTVYSALAHGVVQGGISAAQGGKFISGFASGSLSSLAASAWSGGGPNEWQGIGGKFADNDFGMMFFGTVAGGVGAELSGGNFWQGAATGLIVSGLNHVMHKNQTKTWEKKLSEALAKVKIGEKISIDDFPLEIDKTAKLAISSVTRESETKFKINRTVPGRLVLNEDIYFTIEANQKISGQYGNKGFKSYIGYKITTYNIPDSYLQHVEGGFIANPMYIVGDSAFFYVNKTTISSFKI